jgi:hypothetical protein
MPNCGDTLMAEGQARTALESPSKVCKSVQPPSQTEEGKTTWESVSFSADSYLLGS